MNALNWFPKTNSYRSIQKIHVEESEQGDPDVLKVICERSQYCVEGFDADHFPEVIKSSIAFGSIRKISNCCATEPRDSGNETNTSNQRPILFVAHHYCHYH